MFFAPSNRSTRSRTITSKNSLTALCLVYFSYRPFVYDPTTLGLVQVASVSMPGELSSFGRVSHKTHPWPALLDE